MLFIPEENVLRTNASGECYASVFDCFHITPFQLWNRHYEVGTTKFIQRSSNNEVPTTKLNVPLSFQIHALVKNSNNLNGFILLNKIEDDVFRSLLTH